MASETILQDFGFDYSKAMYKRPSFMQGRVKEHLCSLMGSQ